MRAILEEVLPMAARKLPLVCFALLCCAALSLVTCARTGRCPDIVIDKNASWHDLVAAKELRRYFYLRTGGLATVDRLSSISEIRRASVILAEKGSSLLDGLADADAVQKIAGLGAQDYLLRTVTVLSKKVILVVGGSGQAVLYGAYQLAEKTGIRFYLDGDVVPDHRLGGVDLELNEIGRPLFLTRGIQPFHDFPEGPDWWTVENYKAVLSQLPKLRMNFLGLHTYPDNPSKEKGATPNAEPTVWIGQADEFGEDGEVTASYPSSYQNTLRGNWGYEAKKTGDFHFGSSLLFDRDDYGNDVMEGLCPEPKTPQDSNVAFNRAAAVFRNAFSLARKLGVKTCVGTETALRIPDPVQKRLQAAKKNPQDPAVVKDIYKGLFSRIARAYSVDYYWFWTSEVWTWSDAKPEDIKAVTTDLDAAVKAWREVAPPFSLATCGWVLGPPSNRTLFDQVLPEDVAMSCINREVGKAPVDPGFSRISGRSKWAIPWLEDDPSLSSPQLWVGRMRRDAADALRYGCDGLLGIHWRTRILSANIAALARAAWDQGWNTLPRNVADDVGPITGQYVAFKDRKIAGALADEEAVYRDVRDRVFAYYIPVPNGRYSVTLKFVEGQMNKPGTRVFDVLLQGKKVIDGLDIFERVGKFRALDFTFRNIEVTNGRLAIDFADRISYPAIAAIVIDGKDFKRKINCGGPAVGGYDADWPETDRYMATLDFYRDWATNQFGPAAAEEIAAIFARIDGRHPMPVNWIDGPGNVVPDPRPWEEVCKLYGFVDELKALEPKVEGKGAKERFNYWLSNFTYMREVAHFDGLLARFNQAMEKVRAERDPQAKADLAKLNAVPVRVEMAASLKRIFDCLLATVSTTGELGTIANWEQHILPGAWERPGAELVRILGDEAKGEAFLSKVYLGEPRIVVPAARGGLEEGEELKLKVVVLTKGQPASAELFWRPLGQGRFTPVPLRRVSRGVYTVTVPNANSDIEYYIRVAADDQVVYFPPTAPELDQTVIVY
jgi:hypothetical protein